MLKVVASILLAETAPNLAARTCFGLLFEPNAKLACGLELLQALHCRGVLSSSLTAELSALTLGLSCGSPTTPGWCLVSREERALPRPTAGRMERNRQWDDNEAGLVKQT
ncbi:hypothetical protein P171DRAFT_431188 [Karstenula rhodostoma CBS 690.94]|uniref:Uncharacterized protein n=1 Tax=Karstenula rhodostoma CBS 690.94 TaxID=1392251 RepID=A0A9P4PMD5_9PLEO|nr:hypothetical protein P171DRAFT_431188 [Karstenula rhodostoma CBS 690.94]